MPKRLQLIFSCLLIIAMFSVSGLVPMTRADSGLLTQSRHSTGSRVPAGSVAVPGSRGVLLVPKECVHEMPPGSTLLPHAAANGTGDVVLEANGTELTYIPPAICAMSGPDNFSGSNWIEGTTFCFGQCATPGDAFGFYQGEWQVPNNPPSYDGQILYFFDGLQYQNIQDVPLIQSVVQWGYNGDFGGNYWTADSWVFTLDWLGYGEVYYSNVLNVNNYDNVIGTLSAYNCGSNNQCNWDIVTNDQTQNTWSSFNCGTKSWVCNLGLYLATSVFEGYYISGCLDMPQNGYATMSGISMLDNSGYSITPLWYSHVWNDYGCGQSVTYTTSYDILWFTLA